MRNFANVKSNVPPTLPATISDFNIDDYLNSFSVEEKMVALSNIAGTDTFGRGNGHMSIVPVITVVKEMHMAAGVAEKCPLSSPELQLWVRDSAAKYEVLKRAPKFDFAESLPLLHEANFGDSNDKCLVEKIRNWT